MKNRNENPESKFILPGVFAAIAVSTLFFSYVGHAIETELYGEILRKTPESFTNGEALGGLFGFLLPLFFVGFGKGRGVKDSSI